MERQTFPFELRRGGPGNRKLSGYAAVFNSLSVNLGGFREIIRPGAFAKSIGTAAIGVGL